MSYKIVVDSCCDLSEDMKGWDNLSVVPLTLQLGDYCILDDESFDQDDFIGKMQAYNGVAKTACPSPDAFKSEYEGDYDEVYVLTITDKLSGCYNSACQGKMLYEEEHNDGKKIHIFNSLATSGQETIIAREIKRVADEGKSFDEVCEYIESYIANHTALYFCLESLDALKSNGRLFALTAKVLEKIRVKLVCKRNDEGNISLLGQDLTINRALIKLAGYVGELTKDSDLSNESCIVSYVCCRERAEFVAEKIREKSGFTNIEIIKASGLNSLYASNGGIIVSLSY